jgi:hypothetical protein
MSDAGRSTAVVVFSVLTVAGCGGGTPTQSQAVAGFLVHDYALENVLVSPGTRHREKLAKGARCARQHGTIYHCDLALRSGKHQQCRVDYRPQDNGYIGVECAQPR